MDLNLDQETMRRTGYQMVDWLVERMVELGTGPALRTATPEEMRERLSGDAPADPIPLDSLLSRLQNDVLPFSGMWGHARFFAYIPGIATWPGALADFVVSACNLDASTWREGAGLTRLEQLVLEWIKGWLGYPPEAEGILVSGGSAANLAALACARQALAPDAHAQNVIYLSDQAHSSLARGARLLGYGADQVRVLPSDRQFRMRPDLLDRSLTVDKERGWVPGVVVAAAGSTNTGAVDPLSELAEVCSDHGVWFHVDAAYGGFAALTERGAAMMEGIALADSVTVDPHKWLFQPFECGGLLVRRSGALADTFRIVPHYLKDAEEAGTEINFSSLGTQLTRSSKALKVWLSVSYFGLEAFRQAIDLGMDLARHAESRIRSDDRFELVSPAYLSVVCFRRVFHGVDDEHQVEELNAALLVELAESGLGLISSTRLGGRYALRMCVLNYSTRRADVDIVLDWLGTIEPARPESVPVPGAREAGVRSGWLDATGWGEAVNHPLLLNLDPEAVSALLVEARPVTMTSGEVVVEELEASRDFYLILSGSVGVTSGNRVLAQLQSGDFFGELAAVDWGAGFGSPRMATVTAETTTSLLRIPASRLNEARHRSPQLRRILEETAAARIAELNG